MKLIPARRTLICTDPSGETESGLITNVADEKGKEPEIGVVHAIGEGKLPLPEGVTLEVGDKVIFRRYTENKIFIGADTYNFISFKDIMGVVKKK